MLSIMITWNKKFFLYVLGIDLEFFIFSFSFLLCLFVLDFLDSFLQLVEEKTDRFSSVSKESYLLLYLL